MTYFMWRPTGRSLTLGGLGIRGQKSWPMAARSSPSRWKVPTLSATFGLKLTGKNIKPRYHFANTEICPITSTYVSPKIYNRPSQTSTYCYRMPQPFKSMKLYQIVRGKQPYWFITVCPRPAPQQCSKLCQSWASSRGSPSKEITTTHRAQWL